MTSQERAFLGVESSLKGRRWVGAGEDVRRAAEALSQTVDLPFALCSVLARIGVAGSDAAGYLSPSIRDLLPDPSRLKDMTRAAERFSAAVNSAQRIAIFADYDVDGGASAALLIWWLREVGLSATLYIPDRIEEGYGPNAPAMAALARAHDLIICVDCGTLSHEALAAAKGSDVIVLDHHLGGETLPPAFAVVNPNRQDETGDLGHLCAAGVVFLFLVEVGRQRRGAGAATPDLLGYLDLVALATVADVAPLLGINRAFVRQGLKIMARRERPGLTALADVARLQSAPNAQTLGFALGPRINAGGRIGKADLGARLLASDDPDEAHILAERLESLNAERQEIEAGVRMAALSQLEEHAPGNLAWAAGDGWHPGVVGITASRLKEATRRPAIVIGFDGDDGKGSARSVHGVDIGGAIHRLVRENLIERGGGHTMAAGISLKRTQLDAAMARLDELLGVQMASRPAGDEVLRLDGVLELSAVSGAAGLDLVASLERAGPFGAGVPGPRFALSDVHILHAREVGTGHLKVTLGDGRGGRRLDCIAFGAFDTPLGEAIAKGKDGIFHVAGRIETNTFQGRTSVQLRLEDAYRVG